MRGSSCEGKLVGPRSRYAAGHASCAKPARKPPETTRGSPASAEKTIISIRIEARARARRLGLDGDDLDAAVNITATINRTLEAFRSWFGLPGIVAGLVEKDREALGLGRLEYLQYLVFRRYEALVKQGPAFDRETAPGEKSRK